MPVGQFPIRYACLAVYSNEMHLVFSEYMLISIFERNQAVKIRARVPIQLQFASRASGRHQARI